MAIVKNFWLKGSSKRLGGAVLYKAMGQTRARELASEVTNPRTEAQMTQRIKWSNLVNFYRANQSWMKYAFETKKANQSEYNKFMSLNVTGSRVALTKQAASNGACIALPYIITQGSLPAIEWTENTTFMVSNIFCGESFTLLDTTLVSEFSQALIANNPAIREGDQLSFIRVSQQVNTSTGYPYIIVRKYELIVNSTSLNLVANFLPVGILNADTQYQGNPIYVETEGRQGGFAMILSRTIGGKTYVSSQSLVVVNNEALINRWSSPAAIAAAIASYGESEEAFLSSQSAQQSQNLPIPLNITSIEVDNITYTAGDKVPTADRLNNKQVKIFFNDILPQGFVLDSANSIFSDGSPSEIEDTTAAGNVVTGTIIAPDGGSDDLYLLSVQVISTTNTYTINFASITEYQDGGLE